MKKDNKILPRGIYGITAEKFSKGRNNIDVVRAMINGGVSAVQYREKNNKLIREKFYECLELRKITRDAGVMFIINDHIDIAILVEADGVHIGQDDLPLSEVKKISGEMIVGLSTHSPEQALEAIQLGADYIGVGPLFKTSTKEGVVDPVGLEYLDFAARELTIPFAAIGGIKENNIEKVLRKGAKTICLVTDIVSADDIANKVKRLKRIMDKYAD